MAANIINSWLSRGLKQWAQLGASVVSLSGSSASVPRITIPARPRAGGDSVVLLAGLHLEETSGPYLLLSPKLLYPLIRGSLIDGSAVTIYPVVNQYGLQFSEVSPDERLRRNEAGINYNDRWGVVGEKPEEIALVEADILALSQRSTLQMAVSLHEDSVSPQRAYLWANGIDRRRRIQIARVVRSQWGQRYLWRSRQRAISDELGRLALIEHGFVIVNAQDPGAFENWMSDELKVPTILSEAPFGLPLRTRAHFHRVVVSSALLAFKL